MKEVVEILMRRDNLTASEAKKAVEEVRQMMADCSYNSAECEEIMADYLGLEMDYIFDIL